jgi:hypothetical protein
MEKEGIITKRLQNDKKRRDYFASLAKTEKCKKHSLTKIKSKDGKGQKRGDSHRLLRALRMTDKSVKKEYRLQKSKKGQKTKKPSKGRAKRFKSYKFRHNY